MGLDWIAKFTIRAFDTDKELISEYKNAAIDGAFIQNWAYARWTDRELRVASGDSENLPGPELLKAEWERTHEALNMRSAIAKDARVQEFNIEHFCTKAVFARITGTGIPEPMKFGDTCSLRLPPDVVRINKWKSSGRTYETDLNISLLPEGHDPISVRLSILANLPDGYANDVRLWTISSNLRKRSMFMSLCKKRSIDVRFENLSYQGDDLFSTYGIEMQDEEIEDAN